jgi:hypothetical protein
MTCKVKEEEEAEMVNVATNNVIKKIICDRVDIIMMLDNPYAFAMPQKLQIIGNSRKNKYYIEEM